MRRAKEFYTEKVDMARKMYSDGLPIKEIAKKLGISYSAVYQWVRGNRPRKSRLEEFESFLRDNGPTPVCDAEKKFPKHNELYNMATTRGIRIRRVVLEKNFRGGKNYGTWYFLPGQEKELGKRIEAVLRSYEIAKGAIRDVLEKIDIFKYLNNVKDK